jgi:Leucine-rich repeat (LRR) protein
MLNKMKKYLLCLVSFILCFQSFAQHIDDIGFAQGIRYQCPKCIDSSNNLTDAARVQTHLTVSLLNVADLKGIEGFTSLTSINCTDSKLKTLPANLPSGLQYINVEFNEITSLPNLPSSLKTFDCSNNLLTSLPVLPANLRILDCSYNQITALPTALPSNLTTLFCTNNLLTTIPVLPTTLEGLMCSYNRIKTLPLLPKTLIRISCQYTDIKCLPLLPDYLLYLDIPKTVVCLPNTVSRAAVNYYEGITEIPVNLPFCNDLRPPPCDTFPRYVVILDSINLNRNATKIQIFPNPTEGVVKIKCTNCTLKKVAVFNTIGQLILETDKAILDFSNLGTGMYLVKIETASGEKRIEKIMRM